MTKKKHQLFDRVRLGAIIHRIALQIHESNLNTERLYVVGIAEKGLILAEKIVQLLKNTMQDTEVVLVGLQLDKTKPLGTIKTSIPIADCQNHSLIIVDDVLNTGSTLIYAVHHFLSIPLQQIQTAVLVNRNHKRFPIKADYKGISLSTSYKEHITVVLEGKEEGVYLS